MNNKIKIGIVGLLILSVILIATAAQQPNDYIAFVFPINNFETQGENDLLIEYPVGYIPVTGSATYTYTKANLGTTINLTQPNQINARMKAAIIDYATSKGYNIKKIIYQDYNVVNP